MFAQETLFVESHRDGGIKEATTNLA